MKFLRRLFRPSQEKLRRALTQQTALRRLFELIDAPPSLSINYAFACRA